MIKGNFVILDVESGGLEPFKHSLLQVGAVTYKDGALLDSFNQYVRSEKYNVTSSAIELNKIDLDTVNAKGYESDIIVELLTSFIQDSFGDEKPILVGHNVGFDKYFIRHHLFNANGLNMDDFFSHRLIDTMSLLWGLYLSGKIPLEACSSAGAFKYFGIDNKKEHDALSDAIATVQLFERIIALMEVDKEIDYGNCPYCGSEETGNYDDWIYELGYAKRECSDCGKFYIVYFKTIATSIKLLDE